MDHKSLLKQTASENGVTDPAHIAYILATAKLETDNYNSLTEYADGSAYEGRQDLGNYYAGDGVRYKGRGYVQITGRANYQRMGDRLGYDLVNNPELALNPNIAALITVIGMRDGMFTGVKLSDYGYGDSFDSFNARRIINGLNVADLVQAYYFEEYQNLNTNINMNTNILTVRAGEGFSHLAQRAGYSDWAHPNSWNAIANLNGWASYNGVVLQPGQSVRVRSEPVSTPAPVIEPVKVSEDEPTIADKLTTVNNHVLPAGVVAIIITYFLGKYDPSIPDEVMTATTALVMWLVNLLTVYLKNK